MKEIIKKFIEKIPAIKNVIGTVKSDGCSVAEPVFREDSSVAEPIPSDYSNVTEPIFSEDGRILIFCPGNVAGEEYTVPQGVQIIGFKAFEKLPQLRKVIFPKGLEIIKQHAFFACGLEEVVFQAEVQTIEQDAFCICREIKNVLLPYEENVLRAAIVRYQVLGCSFLKEDGSVKLPKHKHWIDPVFYNLAAQCSAGNAEAMDGMSAYFEEKSIVNPDDDFYREASNFWRFRAYLYGSSKAEKELIQWVSEHPNEQMPSACLNEFLQGSGSAVQLKALGFFSFSEEYEEYFIQGVDAEGVVEISAYDSEDDPDEDGYGREVYYNYWYFDKYLQSVPGVGGLYKYSSRERRTSGVEKKFSDAHNAVAKAVRERE